MVNPILLLAFTEILPFVLFAVGFVLGVWRAYRAIREKNRTSIIQWLFFTALMLYGAYDNWDLVVKMFNYFKEVQDVWYSL